MRGQVTDVSINAILRINDKDAEVLEFVLGYGLAQVFYDQCSQDIELKRIETVFVQLRNACAKVSRAKRQALEALSFHQIDPREM